METFGWSGVVECLYLIFKLFYLYTPLNLLCKEMRCLNKIIIIINLPEKILPDFFRNRTQYFDVERQDIGRRTVVTLTFCSLKLPSREFHVYPCGNMDAIYPGQTALNSWRVRVDTTEQIYTIRSFLLESDLINNIYTV